MKHNPGAKLGLGGQCHAPMAFHPERASLEEARWALGLVRIDSGEEKIPCPPTGDQGTGWYSWLRY